MKRHRRLVIGGLILPLLLGLASVRSVQAGDTDGPRDNSAVAVNNQDGEQVFRLSFDVTRDQGSVVDNQNTAYAYASCSSCRTVAIAVQIVLVDGSPSTVTPVNQAVAINYQCHLCTTVASAHQYIMGNGSPQQLTDQARRQIRDIRQQLNDLRHSSLSALDLGAQIQTITDQIKSVLATGLVPAGSGGQHDASASGASEGNSNNQSAG